MWRLQQIWQCTGLMIGNAAMYKPFGIENVARSYSQLRLLICGYYVHCSPEVFTSQARQFPTQTMDTLKTKKKKNRNKYEKENKLWRRQPQQQQEQKQQQQQQLATTKRLPASASVSSCSRETSARENERSTKAAWLWQELQAQRNNEAVSTIRHSGVVKVPRQLNEYSINR